MYNWTNVDNENNLQTHGFDLLFAIEVFSDYNAFTKLIRNGKSHASYITIGKVSNNEIIVLFMKQKKQKYKKIQEYQIISARKATKQERMVYGN